MFSIHNLSYVHANGDVLFENLHFSLNQHEKVALVGANGTGKSTLLKLIAGDLSSQEGEISLSQKPYYVPQIFGQYNHLTISQALNVSKKLEALDLILKGEFTDDAYEVLNDDWDIEARCQEALAHWGLEGIALSNHMDSLSGGQKTKVFLAGIEIHNPEFVLLDEPTNHLDSLGRDSVYNFIEQTRATLLVVSHDRKLLNLLNPVYELSAGGLKIYGGNYDAYVHQKQIEINALSHDIEAKEKALRKAREKERETIQKQQKQDSRGKGKQTKAGMGKAMMDKMKNDAQNSSSRQAGVHGEKVEGISKELHSLKSILPDLDQMKFGLGNSLLHKGKVLFEAKGLNLKFSEKNLWKENLSFQILSGDRVALKGANGSGKTSLINLLLGRLQPGLGVFKSSLENRFVYIDQDYSLLANNLTVYEQAQRMNTSGLLEHEVKTRLNRFLFDKKEWDKSCKSLSGGERMRLMLCCLTINSQAPDLIVLDEPTNNLDLQSLGILTAAINEYEGTLIVVSHDELFLKEINVEESILLSD